ncbi:MAG: NlpC/P60 family protein [Actinobacteria bacterium]|nr:NlpC/P60 family protein [Actinomycetota bacterium]
MMVLGSSAFAFGDQAEPVNYVLGRQTNPARTVVTDTNGSWVATFTDSASTVLLKGPARTFAESTTDAVVTTSNWVRALPKPFTGAVDIDWLSTRLADRSPDALAIAMQYVTGAAPEYDAAGSKVGGDANYGPLQADGTREEGADFNDYLGIAWTYPPTDRPEVDQAGALDCSGFLRMLWGYRLGVPLSLQPVGGAAIPRRAYQIASSGPGVVVVPDGGVRSTAYSDLATGDLVFFDAATDDGPQIDHAGMYIGRDSQGHYRFVSSRRKVNGPSMGDVGGRSLLDGTGLYARSFRTARRL